MDNKWFESRGLKVLSYQEDCITKVQESLIKNEITVLAACPSAGKTLMTTYIVDNYLEENPTHTVLILTHGTTILRTQFHTVLVENNEKSKLSFSFDLVNNSKEYTESKASVNVALPQSFRICDLKKTDLLIVDEAHHYYLHKEGKENMMSRIIKESKVTKQLLLTGTPSKFIYENITDNKYNIIPVTLNTVFDEKIKMVSDAHIEVATSTYKFDLNDYNDDYELKTGIHFDESDTDKTLDDLIDKIIIRLKSSRGYKRTNTKSGIIKSVNDYIVDTFKELKKTLFACSTIEQAEQVYRYFQRKGINAVISHSKNDKNSDFIETFKTDDKCLVLIVVYRGVLGFNMEKLVNVVDMTTSHNIDRIYQLFSRVIRVDRSNLKRQKLFFKIAPDNLSDYYKHIMSAMLMLSDDSFYMKYNGRNFNDMEIPVKKISDSKTKSSNSGDSTTVVKGKKYEPIFGDEFTTLKLFTDILAQKGELLSTYCMTTIRDVRAEFTDFKPKGYWTKENCIEDAKRFKSISEW